MTTTVFLSRSNVFYRELVSHCLSDAINLLEGDIDIDNAERPDYGKSVPHDMMESNLGKIKDCAVMVADITPVVPTKNSELVQDPIVMLELGYAMGKLGPERIVPILNTTRGSIDKVPVSIPRDRVLTYQMSLGQEFNPAVSIDRQEKEKLTRQLAEIIRTYEPDFCLRP